MVTTWEIFDIEYQTTDGLVIDIGYRCTAQLDTFIATSIGQLSLVGNSSAEGFIPYTDLTETIVMGWVTASLGEEKVVEIETTLQNKVNSHKAAKDAETVKSGLPWQL
jgi:hypothetical protein